MTALAALLSGTAAVSLIGLLDVDLRGRGSRWLLCLCSGPRPEQAKTPGSLTINLPVKDQRLHA